HGEDRIRDPLVTAVQTCALPIFGRSYPNGKPTTVIWVDQRPQQVPMSGADPDLYDITSTGVAVGSSFVGNKTAAWVYTGGKYTQNGRETGRERGKRRKGRHRDEV